MSDRMKQPERFWRSDEPHLDIWDTYNRLNYNISLRERDWREFMSFFMNRTIETLYPGQRKEPSIGVRKKNAFGEQRLALNPIENALTTIAARIASQRPMARFVTDTDGPQGYERRLQAEHCEQLVQAEWTRGRFYPKSTQVFYHGGVNGLGAMHIYPGPKHVQFDVVPPWEFIVDEAGARNGESNHLLRQKLIPTEIALERWGKTSRDEEAILEAAKKGEEYRRGVQTTVDLVHVIEAWHLPSSPSAKDGIRVVCVEGHTLTPRKKWAYKKDRFPFAFFPWMMPLIGWYPQGMVEQQFPVQAELNKLLARYQQAAHLYATTNTYYEAGSINKNHFKGTSGNFIEVKPGMKLPQERQPAPMHSQILQMIEMLNAQVPRGAGISEMATHGAVPARIESGRAIDRLKDNDAGRQALINLAFDDFHMVAAELTLEAAKSIKGFSTNYVHGNKLKRISSKDIVIPRDSYEIRVFPTSLLSHEPNGRMREVEAMQQAGWIDKPQALALLRMPDIEQYRSMELAARDDIERQIYNILVLGQREVPEQHQDLVSGVKMFTSALLRAKAEGVSPDRLELMKQWIERADDILTMQDEAQMSMQVAFGPPPGGGPGGPAGGAPPPVVPPM